MFAISPTDLDWFNYLKSNNHTYKVNFWTPTPWNISKLSKGDHLYFMLKAPIRKIGGFGIFEDYKTLSFDDAWNQFGLSNGCGSKDELQEKLYLYKNNRSNNLKNNSSTQLGCIILKTPIFLDNEHFLDLQNFDISFSRHIVKIKYYLDHDPLINHIISNQSSKDFHLVDLNQKKSKQTMVKERKGQSLFRFTISEAYKHRCCITGEKIPELLEAAHIQPYINTNSNHVKNGLLLRTDLHKLYDSGLLFIDESYTVHISQYVRSHYYNQFHQTRIELPNNENDHPSKNALKLRRYEFRQK
ncbi:HNH endonuclease [Roseivirga sp.]|uniref:HNH endonuclease n=1 Tax=Roseivirga sp. TaxID=1964215 RepID=UPI003B517A9D